MKHNHTQEFLLYLTKLFASQPALPCNEIITLTLSARK